MERRRIALSLFLVSFVSLALEAILFRLFSFLFGHHFVSLIVALATLGYGASGSLSGFVGKKFKERISFFFCLSLVLCLLAFALLPLDVYEFFVRPAQWFYLVLLLFLSFLPFFFHGLLQVFAFELFPELFSSFYALNFLGSALGVGVAVLLLFVLDELKVILLLLALLLFWNAKKYAKLWVLAIAPFFFLPIQPFLSPYLPSRALLVIPDTELLRVYRSPVEVLEVFSAPHERLGLGLSPRFRDVPPQSFVLVFDHTSSSPFPKSVDPGFLGHFLVRLPFEVVHPEKVLCIEEREGLPVYAAAFCHVQNVDFVTRSPLFATFLKDFVPSFPARVHVALPRKFLSARHSFWDTVFVRVPVGRAAVFPGSFSFAEDFLFTREGLEALLESLSPRGMAVFSLFLQNPPSVLPKMVLLLRKVLGEGALRERMVILKCLDFALLLLKKTPWNNGERDKLSRLVREFSFDFVYAPWSEEMERVFTTEKRYYTSVLLALEGKTESLFDLRPPRDSRPYFLNFFAFRALGITREELGKRWLPFGGAGFLLVLLVLVIVGSFSTGFVLLPPLWQRPKVSGNRLLCILGGICTGVGFMFVEIPLFVYLVMLWGFPLYTFSLLLMVLLFFSGLGSLHVFRRKTFFSIPFSRMYPFLLLACFFGLPLLGKHVLPLPPLYSFLLVLPLCALLGYLLGFPFPLLSERVRRLTPTLFEEVFAWNGFFSVLSSLSAHLVLLFFGLWAALLVAFLAYVFFSFLLCSLFSRERDKTHRP
ncbi:MAG: hypothetical protein ACUVTO_07725 [Candidatus Caldatribacteriaceae bacterium]